MDLSNDYLTLKLHRLKGAQEMALSGRGLVFAIVKAGEGHGQSGAAPHRLGSGDVWVVDSAAGAKMGARENGEVVFWYFLAEFEHLFPLFSGREICLLQTVAQGFKNGRIFPGSSPVAKECLRLAEEVPVQFSLDHRSHVLRIVSAILTAEFKTMQPKLADFTPMRDHVLQVFERLQTHELLNLSVGELARKFNCSRRHLNRLFHQHFGLSVASLRMEMRLLKAVSLLVDPDAKIIHVAEKCGFHHLGLFNTCFRKRFGASPSQWRKAVNGLGAKSGPKEKAGAALAGQSWSLPSEGGVARPKDEEPSRPFERVAANGLLKDIAAAKNRFGTQAFARNGAPALEMAAENTSQRRPRVGA
jgi:AraC-like DNA-binding protein